MATLLEKLKDTVRAGLGWAGLDWALSFASHFPRRKPDGMAACSSSMLGTAAWRLQLLLLLPSALLLLPSPPLLLPPLLLLLENGVIFHVGTF